MHIHPSIAGQAERINLSQFSVCINPKCRSIWLMMAEWEMFTSVFLQRTVISSNDLPMLCSQGFVKRIRKISGEVSGSYLALRSLFKNALIYHLMQLKHSNELEFKDPEIRPYLSEWTSGVRHYQFFNLPLRTVLLRNHCSGSCALRADDKAEARKCELCCWTMVVAMKPEVTDPLVCRVFRPLLFQEPCPLVTWEHEQIKHTAVRQYWKKLIFQTDFLYPGSASDIVCILKIV